MAQQIPLQDRVFPTPEDRAIAERLSDCQNYPNECHEDGVVRWIVKILLEWNSGISLAEVAAKYVINPKSVRNWGNKFVDTKRDFNSLRPSNRKTLFAQSEMSVDQKVGMHLTWWRYHVEGNYSINKVVNDLLQQDYSVDSAVISRIENGKIRVDSELFYLLAKLYSIPHHVQCAIHRIIGGYYNTELLEYLSYQESD